MATHDYIISNASGAAVRSDLNNALSAIVSNNSSATEPATTYAYQMWADTGSTPAVMKLRDSTNSSWITLYNLDGSSLPIASATEIVFNDAGADLDFRIEGDNEANLFYVDAGNDRIGIGTASPDVNLTIKDVSAGGTGGALRLLNADATTGSKASLLFTTTTNETFDSARIDAERAASGTYLIFSSNEVQRAEIDSDGDFLLGDTSNHAFIRPYATTTGNLTIGADQGATGTGGSAIEFKSRGTERARIDSSGRLLVGASSAISGSAANDNLQLVNSSGSILSVATSDTTISAGTRIGEIEFWGQPGSTWGQFASISCYGDNGAAAGDCPGRLIFRTTPDGTSTPTERMRINSGGAVEIGVTNTTSTSYLFVRTDANTVAYFDRSINDGTVIQIRQSNIQEGTISVSGSTVSYNGGHLARWSQLPGGVERTEILRGSVLSNIDEMCEWAYEAEAEVLWTEDDELPEGVNVGDVKTPAKAAGTEDNEQLNRMQVSNVEGDRNVAGVFQDWDDDDDTYTNDFYCAMTGDFVIRIAEGVTVERGDLLMSAGDGTAKPQEDDIIRSKTIAKVTSTNVSCTYDDGSYCVPCVLMAC